MHKFHEVLQTRFRTRERVLRGDQKPNRAIRGPCLAPAWGRDRRQARFEHAGPRAGATTVALVLRRARPQRASTRLQNGGTCERSPRRTSTLKGRVGGVSDGFRSGHGGRRVREGPSTCASDLGNARHRPSGAYDLLRYPLSATRRPTRRWPSSRRHWNRTGKDGARGRGSKGYRLNSSSTDRGRGRRRSD